MWPGPATAILSVPDTETTVVLVVVVAVVLVVVYSCELRIVKKKKTWSSIGLAGRALVLTRIHNIAGVLNNHARRMSILAS